MLLQDRKYLNQIFDCNYNQRACLDSVSVHLNVDCMRRMTKDSFSLSSLSSYTLHEWTSIWALRSFLLYKSNDKSNSVTRKTTRAFGGSVKKMWEVSQEGGCAEK